MRSGLALFLLAGLAAGCNPVVPAVPPRDAGPRTDAAGLDADLAPEDGGYHRPDALVLPPADLAVVLPYGGAEATIDLEAGASLGRLDVVFSIDATGSFGGEIDALQSDLSGRIVPALEASVPDVAFAVARFEDMPFDPFGVDTDRPYELLTAVTTDPSRVSSAVAQLDLPLGNGGDLPEAGYEALYQIATGDGLEARGEELAIPWSGRAAIGGGTEPGVGFRTGALRVVVHVTDAPAHEASDYETVIPGTHGSRDALAAMVAAGIHFIGVASGAPARPHLEALALGTGSVVPPEAGGCHTGRRGALLPPTSAGCVLVFDVDSDGTGLSDAIVGAIGDLTDTLSYDEAYGEAVDDRLAFVRAIEAVSAMPPDGGTPPTRADLRPPGDGIDDTFQDVRSGTDVVFRAHLQNLTVAPADYEQVFRVVIRVIGDGLVLVERTVRITVPSGRLDAGAVDAGAADAGAADASAVDASAAMDAAGDAG
jgi:hypothetical protein